MEDYTLTLDHFIDEPIKKCVAGLNLLGFKTRWSCCGFNYKDQLSIKSHIINKPHIYISFCTGEALIFLTRIVIRSGWDLKLAQVSCDVCWELSSNKIIDNNWETKNSIHNYESSIVSSSIKR